MTDPIADHLADLRRARYSTTKSRAAELWADREEPTWLDRL